MSRHDHLRTGREESPETTGCLCYCDSNRVGTLQLFFFSMELQCDLKIYCATFLFLRNPGLSPPIFNVSNSPGVYPGCVFQTNFMLTKAFALVTAIIVYHQASQIFLFNFLLEFSYQLDHCRCTWSTQTSNHQEKNKLMPRRFVMMPA